MKPQRSESAASLKEAGIGDSREFLEPIAHILFATGFSPKNLTRQFGEICSRHKEPAQAWDPARFNFLAVLGDVIARWHVDRGFVDVKGVPAPLPLKSRSRSLTSLITRVLPNEDPGAVIEALIQIRAIRRVGKCYLPTARHVCFPGDSGRMHALIALRGMLKTVEYNVTRPGDTPSIFERVASFPQFPVVALPGFHKWLHIHGQEFLWGSYSNMARRASRSKSGPTTHLNVGLTVFEIPMITGTSLAPVPEPRFRRARAGHPRRPPARRAKAGPL